VTTVDDRLSLTIEKVIHGGRGMGRSSGHPVFVGGTLPGERIEARVTARRKGYAEAAIDRVLTPSADRIDAPCAVYPACGGCQLQHAAYHAQLEIKRAIVQETFQRVGGVAFDVPPLVPSPEPFGYRLRAQLKIGRSSGPPVLGFYAAGSHTVVPAPTCLVLHPRLRDTLTVLQSFVARADPRLKGLREVELQTTSCADDCLIILHCDSFRPAWLRPLARDFRSTAPVRGLIAYTRRERRVEGVDWLEETVGGVRCRVSDRTFLQINAGVNAALIATLTAWAGLTGRERVVDLYAGFGNFSFPLARDSAVTAVESSASAVADARWNARTSGRPVRVVGQSVDDWTPASVDCRPDLVVMDPPRTGLTRAALSVVFTLDAPRLLYVSCESATLARDVKRLTQAGYALRRVTSFDMFPQTAHAETVVELSKV
jgi:23S rRNA (uracil1939-C5)-methyltransferase